MIRSSAINFLELLGGIVSFGRRGIATMLLTSPYPAEILRQWYRITIGSLPVVLLVAIFIGANMVVQGSEVLKMLGAESMVGMLVSFALVREMGPTLAGAMVAVKAGSEIASELAAMRIRNQIDAIEVMGVDPIRWLVVPRLIGSLLAMPILTLVVLYAAVASGWVVGVVQYDLNGALFMSQVLGFITPYDLGTAMLKAGAFGLTLAIIQCYCGFAAEHGPQGVGLATNRAIVASVAAISWVNLVISGLMY